MSATVRARLILRPQSGDPQLDASQRVVADDADRNAASPETVRVARETLKRLGFRVVEESLAGVAFSGDADRFAEVFGPPAEAPIAVPEELAGVAAGVVVPERPELLP
jgi:hypothetical protein